jgi:hypothetical protein
MLGSMHKIEEAAAYQVIVLLSSIGVARLGV